MNRVLKSLFAEKNIMIGIGIFAFFFYLAFNYVVPFYYFNHDLGGVNVEHGHMGYMWYIWKNWKLPVFSIDPVTRESFYNPPLHYILGALWIRFSLIFTDSVEKGFEWLQVLTSLYGVLFYSFFIRFCFY